jgi:adenylate cyclase
MLPRGLSDAAGWVIQAGLAGKSETLMLAEFCRRSVAAGVTLARAAVIIDTLHPVHEGRAFRWRREDDGDAELIEYGPTNEGEAAATWRASAFFHMLETGASL